MSKILLLHQLLQPEELALLHHPDEKIRIAVEALIEAKLKLIHGLENFFMIKKIGLTQKTERLEMLVKERKGFEYPLLQNIKDHLEKQEKEPFDKFKL